MSDNSFNAAAEAVPDQEIANAPDAANPEDSQGGDSQEPQEPKTFTQEEVDKIVAKAKAKADRVARREMQQQAPQEPEGYLTGEPPKPQDFKDALSYAEALADFKAEEKLAQREAEKHRTTVETSYTEREETARDKYDDFDAVGYNPSLTISEYMKAAILESDLGPDVLYHLGKNPGEARRIANLTPLAQAREIGKIEASLTANPPVKKTSSAPDPISPVRRSSSTPTYDPTDPRSVKASSDSDWIKARNAQVAKKYS